MTQYSVAECFDDIRNGASIKQNKLKSGYPITRIETISNNKFNRDKVGYAGITDLSKYTDYILNDRDLLMSQINSMSYLGRTVLYQKQKNETIIHGMNLLRLQVKKEIVIPEYVELLFKSFLFKQSIRKIAKKSVNQASFSINDFKKIKLEIPSKNKQKDIILKFQNLQKLQVYYRNELKKLDELIKARFVEMFGDPGLNKKSYPVKKFSEFAEIDTKSTHDYHKYAHYPHIGIENIEKHTGRLVNYKTVKEDKIKSSKFLFTKYHIIYSKLRPNLNKVAIPNFNGLCSSDAYPILPNAMMCNRIYLAYVMRSDWFLKYIIPQSTGTNLPRVSKKVINNFKWPLAPLSLQNEFANFVQQVDKSKFENIIYLNKTLSSKILSQIGDVIRD